MSVLVLWDVDYTLVNAGGLGTRLYQAVFLEMFGRELPGVLPKAGRTDRAIALDTLALAGIAEPRTLVDSFLAELARHVAAADGQPGAPVVALPGAAQALRAVRALAPHHSQPHQSVLTGNIRPLAELKLGAARLGDLLDFDVGAYGDVHEVRAELVDVARRAAAAAYGVSCPGQSTVLVGDTPLDIEAARAAGARAVGVATGAFSPADLADAGAHAVLTDLTDTARVVSTLINLETAAAPPPGPHITR
jgi:phosphoglycolate phosphatase-like HAD superfamily hydrolase